MSSKKTQSSQKSPSPYITYIEDLYRMEIEDEHREAMQRTVTFNFPAEDACMLAAIAKRFGKSTAAFGGELYADSVRQLFIALSPEDQRRLAAEADAELTRYAETKGVTYNEGAGSRHWQVLTDICQRHVSQEGNSDE